MAGSAGTGTVTARDSAWAAGAPPAWSTSRRYSAPTTRRAASSNIGRSRAPPDRRSAGVSDAMRPSSPARRSRCRGRGGWRGGVPGEVGTVDIGLSSGSTTRRRGAPRPYKPGASRRDRRLVRIPAAPTDTRDRACRDRVVRARTRRVGGFAGQTLPVRGLLGQGSSNASGSQNACAPRLERARNHGMWLGGPKRQLPTERLAALAAMPVREAARLLGRVAVDGAALARTVPQNPRERTLTFALQMWVASRLGKRPTANTCCWVGIRIQRPGNSAPTRLRAGTQRFTARHVLALSIQAFPTRRSAATESATPRQAGAADILSVESPAVASTKPSKPLTRI